MKDYIKYFAYGHNTNISEFKKRVPGARLLGTGTLFGWRLELKHFANIVRDADSSVQGVLYSMLRTQLKNLDKDEDYHDHYDRTRVTVDVSGERVSAITYVMTNDYEHAQLPNSKKLPTAKYINWIAQGYRENLIGLAQLITALEDRINDAYNKNS